MDEIKLGRHKIKTPAVCGAVQASSVAEMRKLLAEAFRQGADLVEIRADSLKSMSDLGELLKVKKPIILTNRPKREGGAFGRSEKERVNVLLEGIKRKVSCVDVEFSTPANLRKEIISKAKKSGTAVLLSHHDFSSTPKAGELLKIAREMEKVNADILKIVTLAKGREDAYRMMELVTQAQAEIKTPLVAFAMDGCGVITRFIGPMFGSPLVYAAVSTKTAPGQLDIKDTKTMLKELMPEEVRD
jgi:3-dehydroquinate dehydratase-1